MKQKLNILKNTIKKANIHTTDEKNETYVNKLFPYIYKEENSKEKNSREYELAFYRKRNTNGQ